MFMPQDMNKQQGSGLSIMKNHIQKRKKSQNSLSSVSIRYGVEIFIQEQQINPNEYKSLDWNALLLNTVGDIHRTAYNILNNNNWIQTYISDEQSFIEFLCELEKKYNKKKNPFHNYMHGIAVMQGCYALSQTQKAQQFLSDFETFVLTFSGLCHDVNHTGRTNIFEINSQSRLATRYHDNSVLEQHHLASTFKILTKEKCNIFKNLNNQDFQNLRKAMISNILCTDIKKHFPLLKDFENGFKTKAQLLKKMESDSQIPSSAQEHQEMKEQILQFGKTEEDIRLLTGMMIHTADFIGAAKQFEISRVWSERVNIEFSAQYEEEGKLGIPQTGFLKDLDKLHILAKGEQGFFKFIVFPLWSLLNEFFDQEIQTNVNYLQDAIQKWGELHEQNKPKETEQIQAQK